MAASLIIEEESGAWTGWIHPHNGYYAGDFSDVPRPTQSEPALSIRLTLRASAPASATAPFVTAPVG